MIKSLVDRLEAVAIAKWRWTFVIYYIILSTATHWPGMRVGRPGPIPIDKILHIIAFAGLAGFLMLTRWCDRQSTRAFATRNILRSTLVALAAAALDELAQGLPGQDRFVTWSDFAANAAGIAAATLVALFIFKPANRNSRPR
jgi:quinol-cytochrome oxidoreductase complex cytochrome b subunit